MTSSMLNAQISTLWYRSAYGLVNLNLNIPVNTGEYVKLTEFWTALYIEEDWRHVIAEQK
jgi:hypothetical protein